MRTLCSASAFAVLALAPARAEVAANLISNGEFDSSLDGWVEVFPTISSFLPQATEDANGCLGSGTAEAGNSNPVDDGSTAFRTCTTEVTPGETYQLQASFFYVPASVLDSRAQLSLSAHASTDCSGATLDSMITPYVYLSDGTNVWHSRKLYVPLTAPVGTQSLQVQLTFTKTNGADSVVYIHMDRVHLTAIDWIYSEDFEIAEPCRWSSVTP